jgi:hypothetical protein
MVEDLVGVDVGDLCSESFAEASELGFDISAHG